MTDELGESFRQSRRELTFQLGTWTIFAAWVVGYGSNTAFEAESETVVTTLGMPSWIVWGIAVPWIVAFAITVFFAGWFMKDTALVDDSAESTDAAESQGSLQQESVES